MLDPADLYQVEVEPTPAAPVMLLALDGFVDAGRAAGLVVDQLLPEPDSAPVATFDADQLVDYRSRRPIMRFERDHWASYATPELAVHELTDTAGTSYLLLSGPEPDVQWERFAAAVGELIDRLGVTLTVGLNAIPMAVPHSRPLGVTIHGTRSELVEGHPQWFGTVDVPGSAAALIQLRLGEAGRDGVGLAVHVPHYLSRSEYPQAALALIHQIEAVTGLSLPTAALDQAAERALVEIEEQITSSEQVGNIVRALEEQYDTASAELGSPGGLSAGGLPSGDDIAAEFERYLTDRDQRGSAE